jgi:hypothetical protein
MLSQAGTGKRWSVFGRSPLGLNEAIMSKKKRKPAGRPEQRLKIEGDWTKALKTAIQRGKPPKKPKKGK